MAAAVVLGACAGGGTAQPPGVEPGPAEAEALQFTSPDGIELGGLLFRPPESTAVIVMAHQRGGTVDDWVDLAVPAAEKGIAAFPFAFRGYDGQEGEADTALDVDLAAAVAFMREQGFAQVGVAGASMGGTAALDLAAMEEVAAVAVFSPPRTFAGLTVRPTRVEEPVLLIAAEADQPYRDDAEILQRRLPAATDVAVSGGAHGTAILAEHPDVIDDVVEFFAQRFDVVAPSP